VASLVDVLGVGATDLSLLFGCSELGALLLAVWLLYFAVGGFGELDYVGWSGYRLTDSVGWSICCRR
jgi:hypothetical protein